MVPSASGAASAALTSLCCSISDRPSNALGDDGDLEVVAAAGAILDRRPPLRGRPDRGERGSSCAAIGNDANDGRPDRLPSLASRARRAVRSSRSSEAACTRRPSSCCPRLVRTLAPLRGDGEEPAARRDRARRRRRGTGGRGRRVRAERDEARRAQERRATPSSSARSPPSASRRSGSSPPEPTSRTGTRVYLDAFVRELKVGRACSPRRRTSRSVDDLLAALAGRLRDGGPADRHPAARARRAPPLARRPAQRRERPSLPGRDGRALRRSPRGGRARATEPARGLDGRRDRLLQLGAARRTPAPARPVRRGSRSRFASEGFGAYAARVARPYGAAVARHFDPAQATPDRAWHRQAPWRSAA